MDKSIELCTVPEHHTFYQRRNTALEFLNNIWGLEPSRNRVIVPARQATEAGGIHFLESIPELHKRLKIRAKVHYKCLGYTIAWPMSGYF
jgi:hypothetical protein